MMKSQAQKPPALNRLDDVTGMDTQFRDSFMRSRRPYRDTDGNKFDGLDEATAFDIVERVETGAFASGRLVAWTNLQGAAESPVESSFGLAFLAVAANWDDSLVTVYERSKYGLWLIPQHQVGQYRVDFLVGYALSEVIVEIDGHDFHERTKKQAQNDKSRDRQLLKSGYAVMRYTGSEVYHDAFACAREVLEYLVDRATAPPIVQPIMTRAQRRRQRSRETLAASIVKAAIAEQKHGK